MGKTSLALNIAMHVAKTSGKAVAVFSLEMSKELIAQRLLSSKGFIDGKKLQTGALSIDEWKRFAATVKMESTLNLLINDSPLLSIADVYAQCRCIENLGLVVIDYLQLVQGHGVINYSGENRRPEASDISKVLKSIVRELSVPVICLSQLPSKIEKRRDKRPILSDLCNSEAIVQAADVVIGLYREEYYNNDSISDDYAECIILKNRRGDTGKVYLKWIPEYTTYANVDRYIED